MVRLPVVESAVLLLAKIREIASDLPVVITGDFNGTVDSDPISVLTEGGMQNTYSTSDVVYGPAWVSMILGAFRLKNAS